jgi:hypothetical protein
MTPVTPAVDFTGSSSVTLFTDATAPVIDFTKVSGVFGKLKLLVTTPCTPVIVLTNICGVFISPENAVIALTGSCGVRAITPFCPIAAVPAAVIVDNDAIEAPVLPLAAVPVAMILDNAAADELPEYAEPEAVTVARFADDVPIVPVTPVLDAVGGVRLADDDVMNMPAIFTPATENQFVFEGKVWVVHVAPSGDVEQLPVACATAQKTEPFHATACQKVDENDRVRAVHVTPSEDVAAFVEFAPMATNIPFPHAMDCQLSDTGSV